MTSTKYPRINVYVCQYNCHTVTVDVDHGVTPFMIGCRARSTERRPIADKFLDKDGFCIGMARSSFYPEGPKPPHIRDPEWEWYRPSIEDFATMSKREVDHYRAHPYELALRPRTDREPIYQGEVEAKIKGES